MSVREPAVAGLFYPADPSELRAQVDGFVAERAPAPRVKAIVAPHAGYVYSGAVAGSVFRLIDPTVKRVLLLGPAHRLYFEGMRTPGVDTLRTPLGDVHAGVIDGIPGLPAAHAAEHSLEVELPFLQRTLGPDVEVVPLLVGDADPEAVAKVIEREWDRSFIIVSSDLSHFLGYDDCCATDRETAEQVLALDATLSHDQACGATPLNALLHVARAKGLVPKLVDLRNSGDTAGDKRRVVGYAAFTFEAP